MKRPISGPFLLTLLVAACGPASRGDATGPVPHSVEDSEPGVPPANSEKSPRDRVRRAVTDPSWLGNNQFRELLGHSPSDDNLRYLYDEVLTVEDESKFLSAVALLCTSENPQVSLLGADAISSAYPVSAAVGFDAAPAIEFALTSRRPRVRRLVVGNLGLVDSDWVRRVLGERLRDDAIDEMSPDQGTVGQEAERALTRLDAARAEGAAIPVPSELARLDCEVGESNRAPAPGMNGAVEVVVDARGIEWRTSGTTLLKQAYVSGTVTLRTAAEAMKLMVMNVDMSPSCSATSSRDRDAVLCAWARPVGRDRVRFWVHTAARAPRQAK